MMVESSLGRKQRKALYNLPWHQRRKRLSVHLDNKLIEKYHIRAIPVRKGDTVKVMRGKHGQTGVVGLEAKVAKVNVKGMKIVVEGATISKADGKQKEREIDPSNVLLTKLDLSDPKRRRRIEKKGKLADGALKEEAAAAIAAADAEKKKEEGKKEVKKEEKGEGETSDTPGAEGKPGSGGEGADDDTADDDGITDDDENEAGAGDKDEGNDENDNKNIKGNGKDRGSGNK
jgi:large subunit ribosomal protein L24